jgi:hypothetical protein
METKTYAGSMYIQREFVDILLTLAKRFDEFGNDICKGEWESLKDYFHKELEEPTESEIKYTLLEGMDKFNWEQKGNPIEKVAKFMKSINLAQDLKNKKLRIAIIGLIESELLIKKFKNTLLQ